MATNQYDEVLRIIIKQEGGSELGKLAQATLDAGKAGEIAGEDFERLSKSIAEVSKASGAVANYTKIKAELGDVTRRLKEAKAGQDALNKEFNEADRSSGKVNAAFAKAAREVQKLTAQEDKLQKSLNSATAGLVKAGVDVNHLTASEQKLAAKTQDVSNEFASLSKNAKTASAGTEKLAASSGKLGGFFQSARDGVNSFASGLLRITGIAGAVSAALGAFSASRLFGGAVQSAKSFEEAISSIQAVSGATSAQLERMRLAAEVASETTKFSAQEAAGALGELARASGDADAAIAQLPATLNLAQAAGIGAAEAATILTTTVTQFGLSASDAARVADLFAREANSTSDTVTSLGNAMSYVAPLAKQLGLNIEQTTAVLGGLAEQGFRGERAGTALRNVFSQLLDPSSAFRAELIKLNITSGDFESIITQLAAAGEKGKAALLSLDAQARPAIASLVLSGGAGIRRLTEDFKAAGGEAERTSQTMGENFAGASARLSNAFDKLRRSLIDPILEPLAKQFDDVAKRVRAFVDTAAFEKIKQSVVDFATTATAAVIKFVGSVDFGAVAENIREYTNRAIEFFRNLSSNVEVVGKTMSAVGAGVSALFNTLQTSVLGIAGALSYAFAGVLKAALAASQAIAGLNGTTVAMKPVFDSLREKIGGLIAVGEEFGRRADANAEQAKAAYERLSAALNDVPNAAANAGEAIKDVGGKIDLTSEQALKLSQQFLLLPPHIQKIVEPTLRAAGVFDKLAESAPKAAEELAKVGDSATDAAGKIDLSVKEIAKPIPPPDTSGVSQSFQRVKEASGNAAEQLQKDQDRIVEQQKSISGALGGSLQALAQNMSHFGSISQEAALSYNKLVIALAKGAGQFSAQATADGTGIIRFGEAVQQAFSLTEDAIEKQRATVAALARNYEDMSDSAVKAQARADGGAEKSADSLRAQAEAARAGRSAFDLLGAADLAPLSAALDAAADRVERLTQQAISARDVLAGMGDSLQDEIDQIRGNDESIENRRFENQLEEIKAQFELAGELGTAEYRTAIARAKELHALKLRQIAEEKKARDEANKPAPDAPDPEDSPNGPGGGGGGGGRPRGGSPITVNVDGSVIGGSPNQIAEQLARIIKPQLDRIDRSSR